MSEVTAVLADSRVSQNVSFSRIIGAVSERFTCVYSWIAFSLIESLHIVIGTYVTGVHMYLGTRY